MSRWEFMRQLEELLSDISPNEREEALQYYNDYFNDAGRENEQEVIKALGSPEQVAGIVREGISGNESLGEFTESGFKSSSTEAVNAIIKRTSGNGQNSENVKNDDAQESDRKKEGTQASGNSYKDNSGEKQASGAAVTKEKEPLPVCAVVAFALAAAGFGTLLPHPVAGIGLIGGACICAALGILFLLVLVFLVGKCIPGIFQGIGYIFKKIFGKKGGEAV